jgi:Lamin Tail Domain
LLKRALAAAAFLVAALVPVAVAASPASAATPSVQITKVYVNAPGSDSSKNVNGEYVVIKNTTKSTISLKSWTLRDKSNHVYTFPSVSLKSGKTFTIYTGKGTNTSTKLYEGRSAHIWNNTGGDAAYLRNSTSKQIDSCSWKGSVSSYVTC